MHQNVTVAEAIVLSCFTRLRRRGTGSSTRRRTSRRCATSTRRSRASRSSPSEDDAAIVDAIDERTLLVPISHVLFKNGEIQDVEPIVRRAHEAGAHVVLDCYQSAGVVPFDLTELGVDFAVGGSVKWLCGGPGAGWLYVRPDVAERLEPTLVGWQAHARPFAFEPELEYAAGARRFLTGTPNVPALYAATAGYDVIEEVGVPRIRERSLALTQLLIDLCDEAGLAVVSPREAERRGGTVTVSTPDHAACHRELGERGIVCDFRPDPAGGIRLGPHFFNTEDEVRHAVSELARHRREPARTSGTSAPLPASEALVVQIVGRCRGRAASSSSLRWSSRSARARVLRARPRRRSASTRRARRSRPIGAAPAAAASSVSLAMPIGGVDDATLLVTRCAERRASRRRRSPRRSS